MAVGDIKCILSYQNYAFIAQNEINPESTFLNSFCAITPVAQGKQYSIITDFVLIPKGEISSASFIVFDFQTEREAKQFINFINLPLNKFLISLKKSTQNVTSTCFSLIPNIYLNIQSSQDLYQYFNLTQEEIDLIESVVGESKE